MDGTGRSPSHSDAVRKWVTLAACVAILGLILIVFREQVLYTIGDFLVIQDKLQPADVIHVIAGQDFRTEYAIELYKEGYAETLFYTGGWCTEHSYYHGEHAQGLSVAAGVPAEAVAIDDSAVTSTYMEAERLKAWIDASPRPIRSVIVVSDPFHMRRVSWTYRWVLGNKIRVQLAPVPFERTPFQRAWWTDDASRGYVRDEYGKLAYYVLRYRLSWGRLREWLAAWDDE